MTTCYFCAKYGQTPNCQYCRELRKTQHKGPKVKLEPTLWRDTKDAIMGSLFVMYYVSIGLGVPFLIYILWGIFF